uniref:Sulfite exporter TauE/SafE family protein n=1 Tax=Strombidium rassoulzadegani TaxID=1082188 RepID=A0A7S3CME8_9SPIT|mmetsp:Transcript_16460/g.27940  ORF Transcript_16460/g.27940 Transcript_16460/m.27940 type:complete len:206 (+) Transcript_16460:1082-1699(+)
MGFDKCSVGDWTTVSLFCVFCGFITYFAAKNVGEEQKLKRKYGNINLVDSDLIFEGKTLFTVLWLAFLGGWVAGALGLGGGSIYNPLLLTMGVPPKVSSSTGMYLVTFSKISACLIYFLSGELNMEYGAWIAFWSTFGSCFGLYGAKIYMEKYGRQSVIVFFLVAVLGISVLGIPYFGYKDLKASYDRDPDSIMQFRSLCGNNGH